MPAATRQAVTGRPSSSTVHAPHSPSPQPSFDPVRPITSRSTRSSGQRGSTWTRHGTPFTTQRRAIIAAASQSRSGVIGSSRSRTPVACATAFAIAGAGAWIGSSPTPFAPRRAAGVRLLDQDRLDRRCVEGGRERVGLEPVLLEAALALRQALEEGEADALQHAALDLALDRGRVDRAARIARGDEPLDLDLAGRGVHPDLGDAAGEGEDRVGVAGECRVVPADPGRQLVARLEAQRAAGASQLRQRGVEVDRRVARDRYRGTAAPRRAAARNRR